MRNKLIKLVKTSIICLFLLIILSFNISCKTEVSSYYGITLDTLLSQRDLSKLEPIDVVILSGQSNMAGTGLIEECDIYLSESDYQEVNDGVDGIYIYACNDYVDIKQTPVFMPYSEVTFGYGAFINEFGPEVGFALECKNAGKNLILIKYTAIGMTINYFTDEYDISDMMKLYILTCLGDLIEKGYYPKVRAACWMQGEADCGDYFSMFNNYEKEKALIKNLRRNFNENLMFIDARVTDWDLVDPNSVHNLLNENKERIAQSDDLCFLIDSTGLVKGDDNTHYDTPSTIELGRRFAKMYLDNYSILSDNLE